jgi:hypothetical protein
MSSESTYAAVPWRWVGLWCLMAVATSSGATLSELAAKADMVVIGTVSTRVESSSGMNFDLTVERVLKGEPSIRFMHIQHQGNVTQTSPAGTFNVATRGMWFLSGGVSGQADVLWVRPGVSIERFFLPVLSGTLPPSYRYSDSTPLDDALVFEAAGGLASPWQNTEVLLDLLDGRDDAVVRTVLGVYAASPNPAAVSIGVAGLLARWRPEALAQLRQAWPAIAGEPRRQFALLALRNLWRLSASACVQELVAMVDTTPSRELRQAAVRALASIHSREALPFLSRLLGSADTVEQMHGIFGLASFANGCPMQTNANTVNMAYLQCGLPSSLRNRDTMANFIIGSAGPAEVSSAVSFWQDWWNAHPELHGN